VDEHEQKCRENVKVVVHNELLWQQFRSQAQAAYGKEAAEIPTITGRTYYVEVVEFTDSYGKIGHTFGHPLTMK
jgi:hypothetical protein